MGLCRDFTPKTETHMENEIEANKTRKISGFMGLMLEILDGPVPEYPVNLGNHGAVVYEGHAGFMLDLDP